MNGATDWFGRKVFQVAVGKVTKTEYSGECYLYPADVEILVIDGERQARLKVPFDVKIIDAETKELIEIIEVSYE